MRGVAVENITIAYMMTRTQRLLLAVDHVDFAVAEGEFVAMIGPSGCGKTSILNAIAGIQPICSGHIRLDGVEITGPGKDRAVVFQTPALLPWRSVLSNVAYGLELQGTSRAVAEARAHPYVKLVGLSGFEDSYPHELSGGMQQRVNLARSLAVEPQVLLLDEPLAALDAMTRERMQLELQHIWMNSHVTALFVTHQISEAILLADRVLVMSSLPGRILADVSIPLQRPRTQEDRSGTVFVQLEAEIRSVLESAEGEGKNKRRGR